MQSRRELILEAVRSQLRAALPAIVKVQRSRLTAVPRSEGLVVVIVPQIEEAESPLQQSTERRLRIQVSIFARGAIPEQAADDTACRVYAALIGTYAARTLGGLATDTQELARQFLMEDADQDAIDYQMIFQITYHTAFADDTVGA